jgi:predicted MFS family arabinose efflux permease
MSTPRALDVNSPAAIASAVFLGILSVISFIIQPGLVEGFVGHLGMTDAGANRVVGIEMLGVGLGTVAIVTSGERFNWRLLTFAAVLIGAVGDAASAMLLKSAAFAWARAVAGLGHGALSALSFAFIGLTTKPDRNLAFYLVSLLFYGAVGLWALPGVITHWGFATVFWFMAIATLAGLITLTTVPVSSHGRSELSPTAAQVPWLWIGVGLAGILTYNLAQGVAWANLGLIGVGAKLSEQTVADDLFLSQIVAVVGAFGSALIAGRVPRGILVAFGILGGAACMLALILTGNTAGPFLAVVCGFNFIWNFGLPFIMAAISDCDLEGRAMAAVASMQMIGLGLGPILSALLLNGQGYAAVEWLCVAFFLVSLGLVMLPMRRHARALAIRMA